MGKNLRRTTLKQRIRRAAAGLLVAFLVPLWVQTAAAQQESNLRISRVETGQFPTVRFSIEAVDAQGVFMADLTAEEVRVLENGSPRPLESLEKVEPGLQLIVAVNAAPMLGNFVAGTRQYDSLKKALQAWSGAIPADNPNDFSLSTNSGFQTVRESSPEKWIQTLEDYQPNFLESQPTLISFSQALELAADPNPDPRMKRAILYITPLPNTAIQSALPNLADRAAELGVKVVVWLVSPINYLDSAGADTLREVAAKTDGTFFLYSGVEDIPNLDSYFASLRYQYEGEYQSRVQKSGAQQIAVQIDQSSGKVTSPPASFSITVLPPNPMFLSPPSQIVRAWVTPENAEQPPHLEPDFFPIAGLIEFPDNHPHPIRRSRLIVDGKSAAENLAPPFDAFRWPLDSYSETQTHSLRIEVEDELGFTSRSIDTTVEVVVETPPPARWQDALTEQQMLLTALLGGTALVMLVVLNRARHKRSGAPSRLQKRKLNRDPLTQPVEIHQEDDRFPNRAVGKASAPRAKAWGAPARLVHLDAEGNPITQNPILIQGNETTIGSDPQQSMVALNEPSVNALHARLTRAAGGGFMLADAGSIAGTWINYAPASAKGVPLQHGDLVHIGRAIFRFELSSPGHIPQPQITPLKGGEND